MNQEFDKNEIEAAMNMFVEWFPEDKEQILAHKDLLIGEILNKTEGSPSGISTAKPKVAVEFQVLDAPQLTECDLAIGMVVLDAICFALGLVKLHISNKERLNRSLMREMGSPTLRGFERSIYEFNQADGKLAKSKALFTLLGQIWKAGGFKVAFKEAKHEMSWWQWAKTGIIATAQITAWFASDGAAFIAESVLTIMDAEQLIEDSLKVGKVC